MTFLLRYCINCRNRCGCIKDIHKKFCNECSIVDDCIIKKNFDCYSNSFDSGTICPSCMMLIKYKKGK